MFLQPHHHHTAVILRVVAIGVALVAALEVHTESDSEADPFSRLTVLEKVLRENEKIVELLRQSGSKIKLLDQQNNTAEVNPLRQVTEMQQSILKGELAKQKADQAEKTKKDIAAFIKHVQEIAHKVDPRLVSMLFNRNQPLESDATKRDFKFLAKTLNPLHKKIKKHKRRHKVGNKLGDNWLLKPTSKNVSALRFNKVFNKSAEGIWAESHSKNAMAILADAHAVTSQSEELRPILGANIYMPFSERGNQDLKKFKDHLSNRGAQITWTLSIVYGSLVILAILVFALLWPSPRIFSKNS